jgi:hypothetical protein
VQGIDGLHEDEPATICRIVAHVVVSVLSVVMGV